MSSESSPPEPSPPEPSPPEPARQEAYQLISAVGHDLRTPLTVLRGAATLLLHTRGELPPGRLEEMLTMIEQQAEVMTDRIEDMLAVAALEAGRLRPAPEALDLEEVASELRRWASGREGEERLSVSVPSGLRVEADPDHLLQAIRALVANALRHVPGDSPVEVRVAGDGDRVRFQVLDRGPGLADGVTPFRRFEARGRGAGLGLYMVRGLVSSMGGEAIHEERPGGGCAFSFTLKRCD